MARIHSYAARAGRTAGRTSDECEWQGLAHLLEWSNRAAEEFGEVVGPLGVASTQEFRAVWIGSFILASNSRVL